MDKSKVDSKALATWRDLNNMITSASEEEALALLKEEKRRRRRTTFLLRCHARYNLLRGQRERKELEALGRK